MDVFSVVLVFFKVPVAKVYLVLSVAVCQTVHGFEGLQLCVCVAVISIACVIYMAQSKSFLMMRNDS